MLISGALLHNPDVLIFDEPLSGLDVTSALVFRNLVKTLAREGKIVLYSSHVLEVVEKICTNVMILRKGHVVANDSVENLRALMKLGLARGYFFRTGAGTGHRDDGERHRRRDEDPVTDQFRPLVRHFFGRFFDNEFVAENTDMQVTVTKLLALLASPGLLLPFFRWTTYLALDRAADAARMPVLWFDRCFLISFAILVMGAVTVLEWDALFPDRRDYASLIPLPIRARTMFLAKVSALLLFLLGFTAAVSLASTILFPLISYRYHGFPYSDPFLLTLAGLAGMAGTAAAQALSVLAASAFVFLSLVALEGVMLNVLSERWFRTASVYVQCAMVFGLLSLFFLFPNIAGQIPELKARNATLLYAFPPAWFLGLNEVLLGSRDAVFLALARWAEIAVGAVAAVSAIAYGVAYRRHVRRTLESLEGSEGDRSRFDDWVGDVADRLIPHPVQRATVAFIGKTLARSAKHRIFLAAYAGVGCAFVLQALVGSGMRQAWLSVPLVLGFFVLSGMRYIFTIPSELPANWVFRISETEERGRALEGARSAMIWFGVAPLFAALAPLYFRAVDSGGRAGAHRVQRNAFFAVG